MHTLHGAALAVATGLKLANHELTVLVTGGDGDGFGIGGSFVHSMRRNVDLLYIVMDNQIYGLTTAKLANQPIGMKTKSMPLRQHRSAINPISLALGRGRYLRRARLQRRAKASHRVDQARDRASRLLVPGRLSPASLTITTIPTSGSVAREEARGRLGA